MSRTWLLGAAFLTAASLWAYTSVTYVVWDGGYDLTVRVSSKAGAPSAVSCQTHGVRRDAEYALEHHLPAVMKQWSATADPFVGEPLTVFVPVSGRNALSGRELSRSQFCWLVVTAVLPDGRRTGTLVEIPDGRVSREVRVELP
ncbi:hypothetical protein [Gemmata sp.]|uniref:hypothetical protein n=1 Tax=Gemmata sp. TaxID=1914242 RepID=UPI003F6EEDDD